MQTKQTVLTTINRTVNVGAFIICTAVSACAQANNEPDTPTNTVSETVLMSVEQQVEFARNDLAVRLTGATIPNENINAHQVTWRSGALGCPKPGESYTQALVKGMLIEISIDNTVYRYHAKALGKPFYCPAHLAEDVSASRDI